MARIFRRIWNTRGPLGQRVKHVAYGYTLQVAGRQERKVSGAWETEGQALDALAARQKEVEAGQLARPRTDHTLASVVAEYLAHKANGGKRSLADDTLILERRVIPFFGAETKVTALTPASIAQYEKRRLGEVKPGTVANELSVLRHLLRLAVRWGYLRSAPAITLPKRSSGRLRYLDSAEIARLLTACRESRNHHLETIVTIALNTGMRMGEILRLRWETADLSGARFTLDQTKSGKPRGVPMNRACYDALVALQPIATCRSGYLFQRTPGERLVACRTGYLAALARAGIAGATFHTLRHTFASHGIMRGVTLAELKELLGHSTIAMTLRYAHLAPASLRSAVDRLDGLTGDVRANTGERVQIAHELAQSDRIGV